MDLCVVCEIRPQTRRPFNPMSTIEHETTAARRTRVEEIIRSGSMNETIHPS